MTWQPVADVLKDVRVVNPNSRGCRDCGTVMHFRTESGFLAYYPGVECCPAALRRQITWRTQEIDRLRKRLQERQTKVDEVKDRIDLAQSRGARDAAEAALARAERNLHHAIKDHFTPQLREISDEIARLKRKLAHLEGQAA